MRKIAALKSMFDEIYEEDLPALLKTFVDEKHDKGLNIFIDKNRSVHTILTSYFKLNN
ncbi:MAG TPA: hypothetical protein VN704_04975 [Verrucomicrobiae bacterium]|nr:hypothetical protein [Verrucomicrobiae bacterium]